MKFKVFFSFLLFIIILPFVSGSYVYAQSGKEDSVFEHLSLISAKDKATDEFESNDLLHRFPWGVSSDYYCSTIECIDDHNHIYYVKEAPGYNGRGNIAFTGSLLSETAKIVAIRDSVNDGHPLGLSPVSIDTSRAFYLPEDAEYTSSGEAISKEIESGNLFTSSLGSLHVGRLEAKVIEIDVSDGGEIIKNLILLDGNFTNDTKKNPSISSTSYKPELSMNILFFDGKDNELFPQEYQFFDELEKTNRISGIDVDFYHQENSTVWYVEQAEMGDVSSHTVPQGVDSIKLKWDIDQSKISPTNAFSPNMNLISLSNAEAKKKVQESYWFYQQNSYLVKINDEEWKEVDKNMMSPELRLRKGLNIIQLYGCSFDQLDNIDRLKTEAHVWPWDSYVFLIYKEGESDYQTVDSDNTKLDNIDVYRAVEDKSKATDLFQKYPVYDKTNDLTGENEKWINLYSNSPYVWIHASPEDQGCELTIDDSERIFGGFYKKLSPDIDETIEIHITPASKDENNKRTEIIHINWNMSDTSLDSLVVKTGGKLTKEFDKSTNIYYLDKNENSDKLVLEYSPSLNTTVEVYADRVLKETVSDKTKYQITLDSDVNNITFKIITRNGITDRCLVVVERSEKGISEESKQRAKEMIDKVIEGNFISTYQEEQPKGAYWITYDIASLGAQYLEGTLAYDVSKHSFNQATDYAGVILELVMIGENPYDYLGTNYVEQLVALGPDFYGPYSNNIWALLALDAAGYPVSDNLIKVVMNEATDTGFDLDMRGWALAALANHIDKTDKESMDTAIETIKEVQLAIPTEMNGYEVTGAFENFWYTNRNINSHACVVSGLTALGIDVGSEEWAVDGLKGRIDAISLFEEYQKDFGGFIRTPNEPNNASFDKDAIIAIGDIYNGSNVWQRYALTNERYDALLEEAEVLLSCQIEDEESKAQLQKAYTEAEKYQSDSNGINEHGTEYFALQEAVFAVNGEKPDVFQGTAEERNQVREAIGKIDTIPAQDSLTYADRPKVFAAEEAFEALDGDERLEHYVTKRRTLEKAHAYIQGIDAFLDAMKEIKKVDLSKAAKVKAARQAYDLLDDRQRAEDAVIQKYADLIAAEEIIEACRTADNVVAVIDTLGQITTLDSREGVEGARASYEALGETQKAYVTNYDHLVEAEEELQRLETLEKAKSQAAEVDRLIGKIGAVNHNSGAAIQAAEEAYQALDQDEARQLVGGYPYLKEARRIYDNLIREEERSYTASQVDYTISRIEDAFVDGASEITTENEASIREAVNAARDQYDAILTGEDPETAFCVTGYGYLLHTEAMLQVYDWQQSGIEFIVQDFKDKVSLIPVSPGLEYEGDILIAFAMYDALSEAGLLDEESEELYQDLSNRLDELEYLQSNYYSIQELEDKILSLGIVGTGSGSEIQETSEMYKSMDPNLQAYVEPTLVDVLEAAESSFDTLSQDKEAIDQIVELIESIREVDLDSEDKVKEARQAYDALKDKSGVSNYLTLINAEYRILELKKEEEEFPIASNVIERIKGLGRVQLDDEYKVISAREAYEALTAPQKKCVKNLTDLEEAEDRIKALKIATVSLNFQNKKIHEGETVTIKADTSVPDANLTWKTSDSSIIFFDKKTGMLAGLKEGNASLTAILDNGNQATCQVEVAKVASSEKDKEVANISLNRKKVILYTKGSGKTITLTLKYNGKKIPGKKVKWKSSRPSIAAISSAGKIKAKKKGTVKVTATYKGRKITCKVIVKKPTLKLNKKKLRLSLKNKKNFVLRATANGKRISGKKLKWSSSNKKIALVSKMGKIIARRKGKTKITAKINGIKTTVVVKVIQ